MNKVTEQLLTYAREMNIFVSGLVHGGSEMFGGRIRNDDGNDLLFKMDLPYCQKVLHERRDQGRAAIMDAISYRKRYENEKKINEELVNFVRMFNNIDFDDMHDSDNQLLDYMRML